MLVVISWLSIVVLSLGSIGVFVWAMYDLVTQARSSR